MAETITFRPTDEQANFIDELIRSGDFANQSEVIHAAIRLLQEQQTSKLSELRRFLQEGADSPIVENWSVDGFIQRMKKKYFV